MKKAIYGVAAILILSAPLAAQAAVSGGDGGIEIEGAKDRRGLFVAPRAGLTAAFGSGNVDSGLLLGLGIGGGVSRTLTLGAEASMGTYFGVGTGFGGDLVVQNWVTEGAFLRGGVGAAQRPGELGGLKVGVGGFVGVGYEFWLNSTTAMGLSLNYDLRVLPSSTITNGALAGLHVAFY